MTAQFVLEIMTFLVDLAILAVLIIEFNYDKIQIEKKHFKKRQRKERYTFERLTIGEHQ